MAPSGLLSLISRLRSLLLRELKTLPLRHQHTGTLGWVISTARHAPLTMNFVDSLTYASGLIFFCILLYIRVSARGRLRGCGEAGIGSTEAPVLVRPEGES